MIKRGYVRALSYGRREDHEKLGWSADSLPRTDNKRPSVVRDDIAIATEERTGAGDENVHRCSIDFLH